jgi:hypothetical protein
MKKRSLYRHKAIKKAERTLAESEAEYGFARRRQIGFYAILALAAFAIMAFGFSLWEDWRAGKVLNFYSLSMFILFLIGFPLSFALAFRINHEDAVYGRLRKAEARRRLSELQRRYAVQVSEPGGEGSGR